MRRFDLDSKLSCYSIILHIPADELWSFFGQRRQVCACNTLILCKLMQLMLPKELRFLSENTALLILDR